MSDFPVHSRSTAPEASARLLDTISGKYGFVPNLHGKLATSPAALEAYWSLSGIYGKTNLSATEQQIVLLTVSRLNGCDYCVAAHSTVAGSLKVSDDVVDALRGGKPLADPKLDALRRFTEAVIRERGWLAPETIADVREAGYDSAQILDILVGVTLKTLSNYTNHIVATPLDDAFAAKEWKMAS